MECTSSTNETVPIAALDEVKDDLPLIVEQKQSPVVEVDQQTHVVADPGTDAFIPRADLIELAALHVCSALALG